MSRKQVLLTRTPSRDDGTLGRVTVEGSPFSCYSLELSDRGNASGISCIPAGDYLVKWKKHPDHGWCWELQGVDGRTYILIHSANLAGNTEQGYAKQVLGCIALGMGIGMFRKGTVMHVEGPNGMEVHPLDKDQRGITDSKTALAAFNTVMGTEDFDLKIVASREA